MYIYIFIYTYIIYTMYMYIYIYVQSERAPQFSPEITSSADFSEYLSGGVQRMCCRLKSAPTASRSTIRTFLLVHFTRVCVCVCVCVYVCVCVCMLYVCVCACLCRLENAPTASRCTTHTFPSVQTLQNQRCSHYICKLSSKPTFTNVYCTKQESRRAICRWCRHSQTSTGCSVYLSYHIK